MLVLVGHFGFGWYGVRRKRFKVIAGYHIHNAFAGSQHFVCKCLAYKQRGFGDAKLQSIGIQIG